MNILDSGLLWIHIIAGSISLILFWIPVMTKKGGSIHRKVGIWYYRSMWVVVVTAGILSVLNMLNSEYVMAVFLGFLSILSAYPLWYSFEILKQKREWTDRYFRIRKMFSWTLFLASIGMILGAIILKFQGAGILMAFFGALGIPAIKDALMTKEVATAKENKIIMHLQGTIISGIAAYTAFLSFGGRVLFENNLPGYLQILPWIMPTIFGLVVIRYWSRKYTA